MHTSFEYLRSVVVIPLDDPSPKRGGIGGPTAADHEQLWLQSQHQELMQDIECALVYEMMSERWDDSDGEVGYMSLYEGVLKLCPGMK